MANRKKEEISPLQKALNVWAIILIVWSLYRTTFKTELPLWFDEFIAKPFIFLIPLHYYITSVEKKKFLESLDIHGKKFVSNFLYGFIIGIVFLMSGIGALYLKNNAINLNDTTWMGIGYIVIIALASSISEEILSRGFVLKRLYEDSKNVLTSTFFASFLFFFLHIPILFTDPSIRGYTLLQVMATDLLLSFAVSFVYLDRRSLVVPILIHAFYNISIYLLL